MADSSRAQLYYMAESIWGETPASAFNELRFTGESLGYNISNTTSREVRSDRQVTDLVQTGAEASGDFDFELSYGAYDPLLAAALFSSWGTPVSISVSDDISVAAIGSQLLSTTTDFVAEGIAVGQWIKVSGFTANAGANNGYYKVVSVASNALEVSPTVDGDEAAAGLTVDIEATTLRNGVSETSFTLEKKFSDVGKFMSFTGMVPGTMKLSISTGSIISGSFGFNGKSGALADATVGTGAPNAAATGAVMNAVDHVGEIREAGTALSAGAVQSLSIQLNNALRPIQAVGTLGSVDIGAGRCTVNGSVAVYFTDGALYQKYLESTATDLSFRTTDGAGNSYIFTLPRVRFTSGTVVAGGADTDIVANLGFQALRDPATDCTIQIDRIAA